MKRTNTFEVVPQSDEDGELLRRLLDASAALWNGSTTNVVRTTLIPTPTCGRSANTEVATVASLVRRQFNRSNARTAKRGGRFSHSKKGEANGKPGYWGNEREGRDLRTYIRNTSYSVEWGEFSRLEILVGQDLKDEYGLGYRERLRLEVRGEPNWKEYDKQAG